MNTTYSGFGRCLAPLTLNRIGEAAQNAHDERDEPIPLTHALVLVLVNETRSGGCSVSGYPFAAMSEDGPATMAHEFGHAFGLLEDEYVERRGTRYTLPEPLEANLTTHASRDQIKWSAWVDASTPLPTDCPSTAVGAFEGALRHFDSGIFRPTCTSKMRNVGQPWREVNTEGHRRSRSWRPSIATATVESPSMSSFSRVRARSRVHRRCRWTPNRDRRAVGVSPLRAFPALAPKENPDPGRYDPMTLGF